MFDNVIFSDDGRKLYIVKDERVYLYKLFNLWNASTAEFINRKFLSIKDIKILENLPGLQKQRFLEGLFSRPTAETHEVKV